MRPLAANDETNLGVGLQIHEAVDHLRARPLQRPRPANVRLLVEARFELDQGGDRLAGLRRLDERTHDGRVVRGAVERLLDRDHGRVVRRLAQELDHHVEGFVRVVDDDFLVANGGKAVAGEVADALGKADPEAAEPQVRSLVDDQLLGIDQVEEPVERKDIFLVDPEFGDDEAPQILRHRRVDDEADDRAAAAALERQLEDPHQVLGLFLDLDLAVADDAELTLALKIEAGKQAVEKTSSPLAPGR